MCLNEELALQIDFYKTYKLTKYHHLKNCCLQYIMYEENCHGECICPWNMFSTSSNTTINGSCALHAVIFVCA